MTIVGAIDGSRNRLFFTVFSTKLAWFKQTVAGIHYLMTAGWTWRLIDIFYGTWSLLGYSWTHCMTLYFIVSVGQGDALVAPGNLPGELRWLFFAQPASNHIDRWHLLFFLSSFPICFRSVKLISSKASSTSSMRPSQMTWAWPIRRCSWNWPLVSNETYTVSILKRYWYHLERMNDEKTSMMGTVGPRVRVVGAAARPVQPDGGARHRPVQRPPASGHPHPVPDAPYRQRSGCRREAQPRSARQSQLERLPPPARQPPYRPRLDLLHW